jgi:prepilin-type N-terminal cleavage/methylation domain-containing protein
MMAGIRHRGFTLIEIMVSLMIFVVVSGAMVSILIMSTELFRRGEFSRSANDETIAVLGAVSDDLNHLVPETGDGWFYAGVPTTSGNTLVAFTTAGQNPDGIGARGQNARSLVGMWVEEKAGEEPRLRRLVLDDSRDITDFISSLVIASGDGGRVVTGFDTLSATGFDAAGAEVALGVSCSSASLPPEKDWFGRRVMRRLAGGGPIADVAFSGRYNWRRPPASGGGGAGGNGGTEELMVVIPSSVLTQGCLHFSAWIALNDIPGMQRPKNARTRQPDWEQLDANGGTRLGPWGPSIDGGGMSEPYDTRPENWQPPTQNAAAAQPKPPFPSAIRLAFVLTGGGRFAPRGTLASDLAATAEAGDLRYSGINGLPTAPGTSVRIDDEWIAYQTNSAGRLAFGTHAVEDGPGRGARRSRVVAHGRGAVLRTGQSYSLVRAIPR